MKLDSATVCLPCGRPKPLHGLISTEKSTFDLYPSRVKTYRKRGFLAVWAILLLALSSDTSSARQLDAVFANSNSPNRICVNDGSGGFSCSDVSPEIISSSGVALGDVNGDGNLDAVFATSNVQRDRVCLGDGSGAFVCSDIAAGVAFAETDAKDVSLGDVNGDGDLDALFAAMGGARICIGDGSGGFTCSHVDTYTNFSGDVALGDVNGDGDLDAVFARGNTKANRVCLGDGSGGFSCSDVSPNTGPSNAVAIGDLNGDSFLDAVFAYLGEPNTFCLGDGAGGFVCSNVSAEANNSVDIVLMDLNESGVLDAVFANSNQEGRVCIGDGSGGFSCDSAGSRAYNINGFALGDVTGNGAVEAVMAIHGKANVVCSGGVETDLCTEISPNTDYSFAVALGDIASPPPLDVTIREINAIPAAQIAQLDGAGATLTYDDIYRDACEGLIYDNTLCGERVRFTAVVMTDPLSSGLSRLDGNGWPQRLHVFVRDVASDSEGPNGMGVQIVGRSSFWGTNLPTVGDVVTVIGWVSPYHSTMQIMPESIDIIGSRDPATDPIFDPIVLSTADMNKSLAPNGAIQINWPEFPDNQSNFVRIENALVIRSTQGDRPDFAFSTDGGVTSVSVYDTSLRYRNDRSNYPERFNIREDAFEAPAAGSIINIQGFLTFPGVNAGDPFGLGVPHGAVLAISPFGDGDLEIIDTTGSPPPPPDLTFFDPFRLHVVASSTCCMAEALVVGIENIASDGFETRFDVEAPPAPPVGAFDARLMLDGHELLEDIRSPVGPRKTWTIALQGVDGTGPTTLGWDPLLVPSFGRLRLTAQGAPSLLSVNMAATSSAEIPEGVNTVEIILSLSESVDVAVGVPWNMLGLPLELEDPAAESMYPSAVPGSFFAFNGRYIVPDPAIFEPGIGYWLRFSSPETFTHEGLPVDELILDVRLGWNMISGPFCAMPYDAIDDSGSILLAGTLFGFDGSYGLADDLEPGYGYWIRANNAGSISLSCADVSAGKGQQELGDLLSEFEKFTLRDGSGAENSLFFGGTFPGNVHPLAYTSPPPAPGQSLRATFADGRYVTERTEATIYLYDGLFPIEVIRDTDSDIGALIFEARSADGRILTVGTALPGGTFLVANPETAEIWILPAVGETLPESYELEQNYPNPFNPVTTIRFALPEATGVTLDVFDVLGRRVAAILRGEMFTAGRHELQFDASALASGIYMYKIEAGTFSIIRRMVVVK